MKHPKKRRFDNSHSGVPHYINQFLMDEEDYNYDEQPYEYEEQPSEDIEVPGELEHPFNSQQGMVEQQPFEILPLARVYAELMQILDQVQTVVYLDKGWCLALLQQFKWDKDYLREQYYNNNKKYLNRAGFSPKYHQPGDFRCEEGVCDVCCSQGVSIISNICSHSYCVECWMGHLRTVIQNGSAFPRCMEDNCAAPVLLQTVQGIMKSYQGQGKHWLNKFQKRLCEMFITTNRKYQFCTGVDCGNCIKINTPMDTVLCTCGKLFCFKCQSDDHYPCTCEQKSKWIQQVISEEADAKWISKNAKICPWCNKAVQRSMGCNFMACTCGKNFCYMCSKPWQPDHKDHFKCHIYKKRPDDVVNREKEVMERLNHCTERYIFNQAVANNYRDIDVFAKRKYLFKALRVDLTESQFMENAYRFAIECCEKLKWIYAFTYFHNLKKRKDAFEFTLGEYEKYKENLLKMLAADLKSLITEVETLEKDGKLTEGKIADLSDDFRGLKKQIVNYYTCTRNFKEKFVQELAQITEELNREKERQEMKAYEEANPTLAINRSKSGKDEKKKGGKRKKQDKNEDKTQEGNGRLFGDILGGDKKKKK